MAKRSPWVDFVGREVRITWKDPDDDWHYFFVDACMGQTATLRGIADKETGSPHEGNCFAVSWSEVKEISAIGPTSDDSYKELIEEAGVLDRAKKIVDGRDKQQHYGPPEESMNRISQVWSGILGQTITAGQVALMMAGLKLARLGADPEHADSLDDLAGYARIYERVK